MAPMLLRRKMSRFSRTTVKFVGSAPDTTSSSVWMFNRPTSYAPIFPVTRPPPTIGTIAPSSSPIRRE